MYETTIILLDYSFGFDALIILNDFLFCRSMKFNGKLENGYWKEAI